VSSAAIGVRPRIAFSGEPGAFAEDAVHAFFADPDAVGVPGFREVFEAVTAGHAPSDAPGAPSIAAGVLPIENLVNGTVRENLDLLLEHQLVIRGEVVVPVRLCLAALPGERIESIERVYSHIQALGQADRFLRTRQWTLLTTYNTAGAGKLIVDKQEHGSAAVLSPRAAGLFGLEILADSVQNVAENRTRFLVVTRPEVVLDPATLRTPVAEGGRMRSTLALAVRNEPGTLQASLAVIAAAGLNMSKLESRPTQGATWEYVFWIDIEGDMEAPASRAAIELLRAVAADIRVLGTYPRAVDL
jgi:prephenate dehydratase